MGNSWVPLGWCVTSRWILVLSGFIVSFDAPWSECYRVINPDLGHPKGTHPSKLFEPRSISSSYSVISGWGWFWKELLLVTDVSTTEPERKSSSESGEWCLSIYGVVNRHWSVSIRKETDHWLLTNFARAVFQAMQSQPNWPISSRALFTFTQPTRLITPSTDKHYSFDSEDDFRSVYRNVGHRQQFFLELISPGRSHYTNSVLFSRRHRGHRKIVLVNS